MRLVAATNNKKKLGELRRILSSMEIEVLSLSDIGLDIEIEENADSFAGNARLKAQAVYNRCHIPTIADDSGLCVDALDGAPGIYSARYCGPDATDGQRTEKLLAEMRLFPKEQRNAKFICAVCCILDKDTLLETSGECKGYIGNEPSGTGGFGYDPIFYMDGKSFSELTEEQKDQVSHRGKAIKNLKELMKPYAAVSV